MYGQNNTLERNKLTLAKFALGPKGNGVSPKYMIIELTPEMFIDGKGTQRWFLDGKYHREDGPAVISADGSQYWYVNDKLHREYGPAIIDANGDQIWYRNDKYHREDGPAVIYAGGSQYWYVNDKLHREDGPAVIHADGARAWYVNGKICFTNKTYQSAARLSDQDMTAIILTYGNVT